MGSKTSSVLFFFAFFCVLRQSHASNCFGGGLIRSDVIGGSSLNVYQDMLTKNGKIYAVGYLYDGPISINGVVDPSINISYPADTLISFGGITTGTQVMLGAEGSDWGYSVDVDGEYLVVGGQATAPEGFPATSPYSDSGYQADAFLAVYNTTDQKLVTSLLWGNWRIEQAGLVAVHAESELVALISRSVASSEKLVGDDEITVSVFDAKTGENYFNDTFSSLNNQVNFPSAVAFSKVDGHLYLLVAGSTANDGGNNWPVHNAFQNSSAGQVDAFIWTMNVDDPETPSMNFATFFGGEKDDGVYDAVFDEEGNVYILGYSESGNLTSGNLETLFSLEGYCGDDDDIDCLFLAVFSITGELKFSSYLGVNWTEGGWLSVQTLDNGGHLVYIAGSTSNTDNFPAIEQFTYSLSDNTTIEGVAYDDGYILAVYIDPTFTSGEVRLRSLFGGSRYDYITGIGFLTNNSIAVAGYTYSKDFPGTAYDASRYTDCFASVFQCGPELTYTPPGSAVSPSPSRSPSRTPSTSPSTSPSSSTPSSSPQSDGNSKDDAGDDGVDPGPIVGGVLGGLVACSCCFILAAFLYRKKKKEKEEKQPPEAQVEL